MSDAMQTTIDELARLHAMNEHERTTCIERVERLYQELDPHDPARGELLRGLAESTTREALRALAERVVNDPPLDDKAIDKVFIPLFRRTDYDLSALFPRLLDALAHPAAGAAVLDLANFVTRSGLTPRHPAAERGEAVARLTGELARRLQSLAEQPDKLADDRAAAGRMVRESVPLLIALCDALALIGDPAHIGKLRQAVEVDHRRVRTEAAAALARLGDALGCETLRALAADPATRTRALAYLEEAGALESTSEELRSPAARAEAELADWLAEPGQFGAPPHAVEEIDVRRLHWPGYDEAIDCRLLRYEYRFSRGTLVGIGIVGPATYSMHVDLGDRPPDDVYAVFAGWQAEHADIRETPADALGEADRAEFDRLAPLLKDHGCQQPRFVKLGSFFGRRQFVVEALRASAGGELLPGVAVIEAERIDWHPTGAGPRALGPTEIYYLHKGRELLRRFNPPS